ncbi:hypothetical protein [Nonomuraea diastatica]|nr:hypothetical protein [Nonomuraea diastatica]
MARRFAAEGARTGAASKRSTCWPTSTPPAPPYRP